MVSLGPKQLSALQVGCCGLPVASNSSKHPPWVVWLFIAYITVHKALGGLLTTLTATTECCREGQHRHIDLLPSGKANVVAVGWLCLCHPISKYVATRECNALWGEPAQAIKVCCRLSSTVGDGALSLTCEECGHFHSISQ